jgi:uncharacterized protein YecT (DUF1311 family)
MELNENAYEECSKTDKELNAVYQQIRDMYSSNQKILAGLRESQLLWIKFRDAQVGAVFPMAPGGHMERGFGSMYPQMYYMLLTYLTQERIVQLKTIYFDKKEFPTHYW